MAVSRLNAADRALRRAFWRRVQRRLDVLELSHHRFGQLVGISTGPTSEWFTLLRMPGGAVLMKFPKVLKCSGHWLLTGQGTEELPAGASSDYRAGTRAALMDVLEAVRGLQPSR